MNEENVMYVVFVFIWFEYIGLVDFWNCIL